MTIQGDIRNNAKQKGNYCSIAGLYSLLSPWEGIDVFNEGASVIGEEPGQTQGRCLQLRVMQKEEEFGSFEHTHFPLCGWCILQVPGRCR